jgi:ABC-type transport system involved in cytochrome c biogenesis permease component
MRHAVEGDTSFSAANCHTDFCAGDEATLARMVATVSGVQTRGLLLPLFLPVMFPVVRNCSTNVFTVFLAGASLHLYWFLNRRWTVTIEFVCRNHSTIRVFCSVISGSAILNDVTAASVAKYGKNTNI